MTKGMLTPDAIRAAVADGSIDTVLVVGGGRDHREDDRRGREDPRRERPDHACEGRERSDQEERERLGERPGPEEGVATAEPPPADAKLMRPGLALHKATNSDTDLTDCPAVPMSKLGVTPTRQTGTKSFSTE